MGAVIDPAAPFTREPMIWACVLRVEGFFLAHCDHKTMTMLYYEDMTRYIVCKFLFHFANLSGGGAGGFRDRNIFVVGNFVFQMCAKLPAQLSGRCAK